MKKFILTVMMAVACLSMLLADEPMKDEAKARADAAIAIAKAKAKQPKIVAMTKALPYAEAVKVAKSEHKPLVVSVGLNCSGLCKELRPDFVTCHEATFEGSATPRLMLLLHDKDGVLFKTFSWSAIPPAAEVKAKTAEMKRRLDPQAAMRQDLLEAAIVEMYTIDFGDPTCPTCPQGYRCVNGTCQPAPAQPAQQLGYGSTQYYRSLGYQEMPATPPEQVGERRFGRRFRAFRSRVRCAMGLERHQDGQLPFSATVGPPAQPTAAPEVFGAVQGPFGHRLIKAYLVKHGVDAGDLDKLETKYGANSNVWAHLLKLFLDEGLPLVIEWLKTLIG